MGKQLVLVLGGARSGKSLYAERRVAELAGTTGQVLYIATAEALDDEMAERIRQHRATRPAAWRTLEEPREVGQAIEAAQSRADALLVDCVTLWISNLLLGIPDGESNAAGAEEIARGAVVHLLATYHRGKASMVLVTNEVGMGLVPDNPLGRTYRDLLGRVNMWLAEAADEVILMVAGLPLHVKPTASL